MILKGIRAFELYQGEYRGYGLRFKNKNLIPEIDKVMFICNSLDICKTFTYDNNTKVYFAEFLSDETKEYSIGEHIFSVVVNFKNQKPIKEDGLIMTVLENLNQIEC